MVFPFVREYDTAPEQESPDSQKKQTEETEKQRQAWLDADRNRRKERQGCGSGEEAAEEELYTPPTIMLASDLHYMSRATHNGKKTGGYHGKDRKETGDRAGAAL